MPKKKQFQISLLELKSIFYPGKVIESRAWLWGKRRIRMHFIETINIDPLLKAFQKFERFRVNDKTEQERAGTIQAFEYAHLDRIYWSPRPINLL